ncbi:MAG TPA: hypothetical protein VGN72_24440 [Tepidisphaeraceae bacterium]|jgi:hypothetical protein|nr:hypothetical protein [Tepidisphaeraceae bacterium]
MGKADTSLPDPLNAPAPALAGTDDLLSQLAGDEIDRLLAEADVEAPTASDAARELDDALATTGRVTGAPTDAGHQALQLLDSVQLDANAIANDVRRLATSDPAPLNAIASPAPAAASSIDAELQALFAELNQPVAPVELPQPTKTFTNAPPEPAAGASTDNAALSAEIDDLFKQLTAEEPTATTAASDAPPITDTPTTSPVAGAPATPVAVPSTLSPMASTTTAPAAEADAIEAMQERAGLGLAGLATSVATASEPPTSAADDEAPLPLILRPLEWLNAPLAAAPDSFRDLLGKAAIVTFVNAAAVLAYVMLFRK